MSQLTFHRLHRGIMLHRDLTRWTMTTEKSGGYRVHNISKAAFVTIRAVQTISNLPYHSTVKPMIWTTTLETIYIPFSSWIFPKIALFINESVWLHTLCFLF